MCNFSSEHKTRVSMDVYILTDQRMTFVFEEIIFVTESFASKLAAKAKNETFVPDTPEPRAASKKSPVKPPFKTKAKVQTVSFLKAKTYRKCAM